jgi:hypothetical protein
LFRVLSAFDALFEGVFKTVPVCDTDAGVCFTKITVWPDYDVFVVWISISFIVGVAREGICMVCSSWFVFQQDIVLLPFREISCNVWPDFSGVIIVPEVCMIGVYQDRDSCSF